MKFKSDIEVQAGLKDSSGAAGTSGQILSSNGTTVSWINAGESIASDVQNLVKAGVAINKGQAVYVTSADGTNIIVGLASNTSEATSSKTLGLLDSTVATNGMANVVQIGKLAGLNTIGANAGDAVWLGTNGNLIYGLINKPYAPAHLVYIGVVTRVNANNGEIFVNVQNGFELKEIHDVDIITTPPTNGDVLGYNGSLWVNKTIPGWLGYTPADQAITISTTAPLSGGGNLSANRTLSIAQANATTNGYLSSADWTTFNNKQVALNGTGFVKASGTTISYDNSTYTPTSRTITINGVTQDLSANQTWTIAGGVTSFNTRTGAITLTSGDVTTALGYTPVTNARTITINGVAQDLSANRSWTVTAPETDTLQTVTDRGSITTNPITINSASLQHLTLNNRFNFIGSENFHISNNAYYSSGFKYKFAGNASKIALNSDNSFVFQTAVAGTPDAAITFENKFWADSAGNALSTGSMRSPIFYDYNDTSYYIDPAGNSNLYYASFSNDVQMNGNYLRFDQSGTRSWNIRAASGNLNFNSGDGGGTYVFNGGTSFSNSSSWFGGYGPGSGPGLSFENQNTFARIVFWGLDFYDWNHGTQMVIDNGYVSANNSFRAPIFYDSNNTGYYLDPASSSYLNVLTCANVVNGAFLGVSNTSSASGNGISLYNGGGSGQPTYGLMFAGTGSFGTHGSVSGDWATYFTMNDDSARGWIFKRGATNVASISGGGILQTSGYMYSSTYMQSGQSMYSPIYYDSNDTGYYIDPAGNSNLSVVAANRYISNAVNNTGGLALNNNSTYWGLVYNAGANDWRLGYGASNSAVEWNLRWDNGNTVWANGSMRAPVFYDSNDTTYYLDPNSTGTSYRGRGEILLGPNTSDQYIRLGGNGGATDYSTVSTSNGNLHIDAKSGNNLYLGWYNSSDVMVGGGIQSLIYYDRNNTGYYLDPASTSNLNAVNVNGNLQVWGAGGNYNEGIRLVSGTGSWSNIQFGANSSGSSTQANQWIVGKRPEGTFVMSLAGNQDGGSRLLIDQYGGLLAPIYYDGNNTGYYLDPASTSNINALNVSTINSRGTSQIMYYEGFTLNADTMSSNSTGFSYQVNSPFYGPIARFSAGGGYDMWITSPYIGGNGFAFRTRNGDNATINAWKYPAVYGSVNSGGSLYATIYYDQDNSGYYLDPNSTSNLYAANFSGPSHFTSNSGGYCGSLSNPPLQAYSDSNNSAFFSFHKGGHYAVNMGLDADNVIRIGGWSMSSNRFQMDASGNLTMSGDVTAYSDARVKENVVTVNNALEKVNALRGVYYNRIDSEDKKTKLGVIAQEILEVVPEVVGQDNAGMYNVSYGNLAGLFIEAIKEQQTQIEELKELVNKLINKQ